MTDDLERLCADTTAWLHYDFDEEQQQLVIYRRCDCGRYLRTGGIRVNFDCSLKLTNWLCKKCGEVQPYFEWVEK